MRRGRGILSRRRCRRGGSGKDRPLQRGLLLTVGMLDSSREGGWVGYIIDEEKSRCRLGLAIS